MVVDAGIGGTVRMVGLSKEIRAELYNSGRERWEKMEICDSCFSAERRKTVLGPGVMVYALGWDSLVWVSLPLAEFLGTEAGDFVSSGSEQVLYIVFLVTAETDWVNFLSVLMHWYCLSWSDLAGSFSLDSALALLVYFDLENDGVFVVGYDFAPVLSLASSAVAEEDDDESQVGF